MNLELGGLFGPFYCLVVLNCIKACTLASMMMGHGQFEENEENSMNFQEIYSRTLMQVAMYLRIKERYTDSEKAIPEYP